MGCMSSAASSEYGPRWVPNPNTGVMQREPALNYQMRLGMSQPNNLTRIVNPPRATQNSVVPSYGARVILMEPHRNAGEIGTFIEAMSNNEEFRIQLDSGEIVRAFSNSVGTDMQPYAASNSRHSEERLQDEVQNEEPILAENDCEEIISIGDRVELKSIHGSAGKRGFVHEIVKLDASSILYTIQLDDGTLTHAGNGYLSQVCDGAAQAIMVAGEDDNDTGNGLGVTSGIVHISDDKRYIGGSYASDDMLHIDSNLLYALKHMSVAKEWREAESIVERFVTCGKRRASEDSIRAEDDEEAADCIICCCGLCFKPTAVLINSERLRACQHYFHVACLSDVFLSKNLERTCPMCRTKFEHYVPLPDIRKDPRLWFRLVAPCRFSNSYDKVLSLSEASSAVESVLPISSSTAASLMSSKSNCLWERWKKRESSTENINNEKLSEEDFLCPRGGLFVWILAIMREIHRRRLDNAKLPKLFASDSDYDAELLWFDFWDFTASGIITQQQLTRALSIAVTDAVTYSSKSSPNAGFEVRKIVAEVWKSCLQTQRDDILLRKDFHHFLKILMPRLEEIIDLSFTSTTAISSFEGKTPTQIP